MKSSSSSDATGRIRFLDVFFRIRLVSLSLIEEVLDILESLFCGLILQDLIYFFPLGPK